MYTTILPGHSQWTGCMHTAHTHVNNHTYPITRLDMNVNNKGDLGHFMSLQVFLWNFVKVQNGVDFIHYHLILACYFQWPMLAQMLQVLTHFGKASFVWCCLSSFFLPKWKTSRIHVNPHLATQLPIPPPIYTLHQFITVPKKSLISWHLQVQILCLASEETGKCVIKYFAVLWCH